MSKLCKFYSSAWDCGKKKNILFRRKNSQLFYFLKKNFEGSSLLWKRCGRTLSLNCSMIQNCTVYPENKILFLLQKAKSLHSKKASGNEAFTGGRYEEAFSIYSEALEVDPLNKYTNAKIYYNRALVDTKLRKMHSAIEDCTKAIELDSSYLKAYLKRAKW